MAQLDEHDKVIEALYTAYKTQYPKVYKNPNQEKNTTIKGHPNIYPDIIVTNEQNILVLIEEVETRDFVTEEHAKEQWVAYSKVRTTFYLMVPFGSQINARAILTKLKITATVRCYSITKDGKVTFLSC